MSTEVTVPRLGWSMEEGTFCEWLKDDGEKVEVGDMLFVLEGEKASQEIESFDAGYLRLPPDAPNPGDTVAVGQRLAFLADKKDMEPWTNASQATQKAEPKQASQSQPKPTKTKIKPRSISKAITPRAMNMASRLGVDWTQIEGTGRSGRIREKDIQEATLAQTAAFSVSLSGKTEPLSPIRKVIARQMVEGANLTAPVTLHREIDASRLINIREKLKQSIGIEDPVPTYNDILIRLAAESLKHHPRINSQWREEGIFLINQIHIAFAVDTPSGLLTPVIKNADKLTLIELAKCSANLIKQSLEGKLEAHQMQNATFTVTNLGGLGIEMFTPIINPPQCAILGIGRINRKMVWVDNKADWQDRVPISLTFDHRIVDGAPAARFLETLCEYIQQPPKHISKDII
ncbi:MAG: dihydrolipoamide acetyltransferase family protein [Verrucomicrobiota bacterium]|nr:dihydrolipoamide acetyltransferase family protein [Verrucomicrobiota bacterium]